VTFVDIPGWLPGVEQVYGGIIRHGARLLFACSAATVQKKTSILRGAYGGGSIARCAKDLGADCMLARPSAEIAVRGAPQPRWGFCSTANLPRRRIATQTN